jgi:hypothetical protein
MLYSGKFTNWTGVSWHGNTGFISAYGMLKSLYPAGVYVPNLGMNLQINSTAVNLYSPNDLVNIVLAIAAPYNVGFSSKNSINADDYVLSGSAPVEILLEVG